MKKIKYNIAILFLSVLTLTAVISCDEGGEPTAGGTFTEAFAGDWHIKVFSAEGDEFTDYGVWETYNAASNDENFWIDDHETTWNFKTKVHATDMTNLTFEGDPDSEELIDGFNCHVTNGKILKNAATSLGGHVVDSIYFEVTYTDDPETVYVFKGHKRTGFLEDEL